jgi:LPXTG-site transpeptidase (sortase) family protein
MRRQSRSFGCFSLLVMGVLAGALAVFAMNAHLFAAFAPQTALTLPPGVIVTPEVMPATSNIIATPEVEPLVYPTQVITSLIALPDIPRGTFVVVPTAQIQAPIVRAYRSGHSWDVSQLARYAGHLDGTSAPGETGNVVLAGHVELANGIAGPFARLKEVAVGDAVYLLQNGVQIAYTVTDAHYTDEYDIGLVQPTPDDRVTLITCDSYDFISNVYQRRFVVIARKNTP